MKKVFCIICIIMTLCFFTSSALSADKVVVIPLSGAKGDAIESDVLYSKTFSNSAANGLTGTRPPAPVEKTGQMVSYASGDDGDYELGEDKDPRWETSGEAGFGIIDRLTGLIWQNPLGGIAGPWGDKPAFDGLEYCEELITGGKYSDWRMPNVKELQSLIDFGQSGPALPAGHPFSFINLGNEYWTSTTWINDTNQAWTFNLDLGLIQTENKINSNSIWCVRGPH